MRSSHARHALSRSVASLARQRGRSIAAGMTLLLGSVITGAVAVHDDSLGRNPVAQPLRPDVGNPVGPDESTTPAFATFGTPPVPGASASVPVIPASLSVSDDGAAALTQRVPFAPSGTIRPVFPVDAPPWNPDQSEQPPPVEQPGASPSEVVTEPADQTLNPMTRPLAHALEPVSEPATAALEPVTTVVEDTATPAMAMLTPVLGIVTP